MSSQLQVVPTRSQRPERVTDLLFQGGVHGALWGATARKPRFYVMNLQAVIGLLGIIPANMRTFFEDNGPLVAKETNWGEQAPVTFGCNFTHIQRTKTADAKFFEHAVTIIFVLEKYAEKHRPSVNVYDYLRLMPAQYFIDDFDKDMLDDLKEHYDGLSAADRESKFGPDAPEKFEQAVLKHLKQPLKSNLIKQMAWGFCVTRYVADHVRLYINTRFPSKFHLGAVLSSGQNANLQSGGSKSAAADMAVPLDRSPERLAVIPLAAEQVELDPFQVGAVKATDQYPVSKTITGVDWTKRI